MVSSASSRKTTPIPTPAEPLGSISEADVEVEGTATPLNLNAARMDAKRYLEMFKKTVHKYNSKYKVHADLKSVSIVEESSTPLPPHIFPYNACSVKSYYLALRSNNNNVVAMLKYLSENPAAKNQFSNSDYKTILTPPLTPNNE